MMWKALPRKIIANSEHETGYSCRQPGQSKNKFSHSLNNYSCLQYFNLFYTVPAVVYPLDNITVTEGENSNLTCNVSGSPALSVTWTKVKTGSRTMGITLELIQVNRNESGEYKCEASNSCGNDTTSTFLIVQCK